MAVTVNPAGLNDCPAEYDLLVAVPLRLNVDNDLTVIVAVPLMEVLMVEVAVIVAVPAATPVTTPLLTVAILLLLLDQVTLEEPESTFAVKVTLPPTAIDEEEGETVIVLGAVCEDAQID